ncbi:hypothetical protein K1X12_15905 [Hyphomonas sp. WL0036]|uniref:hypothetical protein n=1 Tax=Hyphomonas sediminis TaxID=2866160 RepID=UPI001C7ED743|nr:hypothetical protein [Hyphomonas sediminis]MBY9068386.1 hypothetical protein [Hyphomonas sediminis]
MRYLILAATALLTACSPASKVEEGETLKAEITSPVDSAAQQSTTARPAIDPSALDLSRIALAMRIPAAFQATGEGAYLQINVINQRLGVDVSEEFPLIQTSEVSSPFLEAEAREGFRIWTYGTRTEDAPLLMAISEELARLKSVAPGENELSFGAAAPGCWNEAEQTPASLKRTLYIRVNPEADFQLFVPEQEIGQGEMPGMESFWASCAAQ